MTAHTPKRHPFHIGPADDALLRDFALFLELTIALATRRRYKKSYSFVSTRLKRLKEEGYLLAAPMYPSGPLAYTLSQKGWHYIATLGMPIPRRFRPGEVLGLSYHQRTHRLGIAAFGVALARFCDDSNGAVRLAEFRHERFLKEEPVTISLPGGSRRVVIPDAWADVRIHRPAGWAQRGLLLEYDRATEYQQAFRRKVAGLITLAGAPYEAAFGTSALTICLVTPTPQRRAQLTQWIEAELTGQGRPELGSIFRITSADPGTVAPAELFLSACWVVPYQPTPVPLFTLSPLPGREQPIEEDHSGVPRAIADFTTSHPPDVPLVRTHFLPLEDYLRFLTAIGEDVPMIRQECRVDKAA